MTTNLVLPARTRIKFCGLSREQDVADAVAVGADALGFVLWPGSKRCVDEARLAAPSARVPAFVTRVGLFVDQQPELIARCAEHLDLLQFHGDETPAFCAGFGRPWIKALRMRDDLDLHAAAEAYAGAQALLLDAYRPGVPGGTGETFDWSRIPANLAKPVILAGGSVRTTWRKPSSLFALLRWTFPVAWKPRLGARIAVCWRPSPRQWLRSTAPTRRDPYPFSGPGPTPPPFPYGDPMRCL